MIGGALRRILGLQPARARADALPRMVTMRDGARLSALHLRPTGIEQAGTVLIRTPSAISARISPMRQLGALLCEQGHHVVLQEVRGRYGSEGEFAPFLDEQRDGGDTLAWLEDEPWFHGDAVLLGMSYGAYAAWAAFGARPASVGALVVIEGTRDPYQALYGSGAFALETALRWAALLGARQQRREREIDFARGLAHRPLLDADRVSIRRLPQFREWLAHPRRDAYWQALQPRLPASPPPTLSIAGFSDPFLDAQLRDFEAVADVAGSRLVIGPWQHGRVAERGRWRGQRETFWKTVPREVAGFLDRHFGRSLLRVSPVRYFDGTKMRDADRWPPPTEAWTLNLHANGSASSEPPGANEAATRFVSDPEDPCPSLGGARLGSEGGVQSQEALDARGDVPHFDSEPLTEQHAIAGAPALTLWLVSDAPDCDLSVRLLDVSPDGSARLVGSGHLRVSAGADGEEPAWLTPAEPRAIEMALWPCAWRFEAGHRVRLAIAASDFPRYDRNPQSRAAPASARAEDCMRAELRILHDEAHPSCIALPRV